MEVRNAAEVAEWARVLVRGTGMPAEVEQLFAAAAATAPEFLPVAAREEDRVVAAALSFRDGPVASLCGAATLPTHRGRGAQSALVRLRVQEAVAAGAAWICAEAYRAAPGTRNPSLHYLLRAGFVPLYERPSWVWLPRWSPPPVQEGPRSTRRVGEWSSC
ncbi:GNAT family N-acetyltransferase [Kineococcus sp. SYSU DK006]|uniref:GNAT family N-acetyltransferase n=1 Tax=Kineococcus sp. SYSU DK006 TaxID=3383127 RepID=UPI003D7C675E